MKHYEYEISQFIDNELQANEQKELFVHLAECNQCVELLSKYMAVKTGVKNYYSKLDTEILDIAVCIPKTTGTSRVKTYKAGFYISSAAAAILALLFLLQLNKTEENRDKYLVIKKEFVSLQKKTLSTGTGDNKLGEYNPGLAANAIVSTLPGNSAITLKNDGKDSNTIADNNLVITDELFQQAIVQDIIPVSETVNGKEVIKYRTVPRTFDSPNIIKEVSFTGGNKKSKNGMAQYFRDINGRIMIDPSYVRFLRDSLKNDADLIIRKLIKDYNKQNAGTRDLKQQHTTYIDKNGKIQPADVAGVRDLFLREIDIYAAKPVKSKKKTGTKEIAKHESRYNDYLKSFKSEKVTQSDFLTPQIIGN